MMNEFGCIPNELPNLSLICLSLAQSNQTIKDKVLAFEDRVAPIDIEEESVQMIWSSAKQSD